MTLTRVPGPAVKAIAARLIELGDNKATAVHSAQHMVNRWASFVCNDVDREACCFGVDPKLIELLDWSLSANDFDFVDETGANANREVLGKILDKFGDKIMGDDQW